MLFVELQRVDHTQHFVDVTTQRQIVYDRVANNTVSVNQERAAQRNAFVRMFGYRKLSEFHASRQQTIAYFTAQCRLYRQVLRVVDELQSRKKRRPLQRASGILHNVLSKAISLTANKSEVHRPEEQNGCFTIGVLFEVEFINNYR